MYGLQDPNSERIGGAPEEEWGGGGRTNQILGENTRLRKMVYLRFVIGFTRGAVCGAGEGHQCLKRLSMPRVNATGHSIGLHASARCTWSGMHSAHHTAYAHMARVVWGRAEMGVLPLRARARLGPRSSRSVLAVRALQRVERALQPQL